MELSQRKEFILSTIVEFYISTGQPVGSKLLVTALPFTLSSATIRNEMADLVQMGYLEQPHTSAGRIPTDKGLKYYTEKLLRTYSPSEAEAFRVVSGIDHFEGDDAVILTQACDILAELTGTLAFATLPGSDAAVVTGVQVLPIGKKQAMIIVSTSAGSPVSRISRLTDEADFTLFELFYNAAAANFIGRNREEIGRADLQRITSSLGENALPVAPLLTSFFEALEISRSPRVVLAGVVAECCVLATLMDAIDLGYEVIYLHDCISGCTPANEKAVIALAKTFSPIHTHIVTADEYIRSISAEH